MALKLHFRLDHPKWKKDRAQLRKQAKSMCEAVMRHPSLEKKRITQSVSLVLSDDPAVQRLNHDFRGKDVPTNVLSFPAGAGDEPGYLGDIIVSLDTVRREAENQGKPFDHHLAHLVAHGLLHLLGYDHETSGDAKRMESLEIEILEENHIPNPYL